MCRRGSYWLFFIMMALCTALLNACTNDLKKIQEISQKLVNSPADTTRGVDIIYSDSARVKAHIFAPLMLEYQPSEQTPPNPSGKVPVKPAANTVTTTNTSVVSRKVMPKGIKIIFYDNNQQVEGNIVADTAYYFEDQQLIKMRKNVVLTSAKGDVFQSQELDWDRLHDKITSSKPVDITMANGNKSHGTSMETNKALSPITIQNQTGLIYVDSKMGH